MAKKTLKSWVQATRPWSFTASALSLLVSLAYLEWATGAVNWLNGMWAMAALVIFHAGGNTWSDWLDYRYGIDADDAHSVDTLTSGRFTPASIRNLSLGLYAVAAVLGVGLMLRTGLPLLWIGLAGLFLALLYPPLKCHALGDVVILLNFCVLPALGASYAATGRLEINVLWAALPVGLLVDSILHANNTRDMRTDRRAHAYTLAQALGARGSNALYVLEIFIPFIWTAALAAIGVFPVWSGIVLLLLPLGLCNARIMQAYRSEEDASAIAGLDQRSAQLQLLFSVLFTLSFMLDIWLR